MRRFIECVNQGRKKTLGEEVGLGFCHRSPNEGKPGLGYIKPALKSSLTLVNNESVMGTLTGVAWNALSTLLSFCFTW